MGCRERGRRTKFMNKNKEGKDSMKSFLDYINDNGGEVKERVYLCSDGSEVEITAVAGSERDGIKVYLGSEIIATNEDELCDWFYDNHQTEIHFCDHCGGIMQSGCTDDQGDFHTHEGCFVSYMNNLYGEGNWRELPGDELNELGGWYEVRKSADSEWEPDGSYYTDWY